MPFEWYLFTHFGSSVSSRDVDSLVLPWMWLWNSVGGCTHGSCIFPPAVYVPLPVRKEMELVDEKNADGAVTFFDNPARRLIYIFFSLEISYLVN